MIREIEGEIIKTRPHRLVIDERERVTVTGVQAVDSFDENEVVVMTDAGIMVIMGEGLHLSKLNLEDGQLIVEGMVMSVDYNEVEEKKSGFFSNVFR